MIDYINNKKLVAEVILAYKSGMETSAIIEIYGISETTLYNMLKKEMVSKELITRESFQRKF